MWALLPDYERPSTPDQLMYCGDEVISVLHHMRIREQVWSARGVGRGSLCATHNTNRSSTAYCTVGPFRLQHERLVNVVSAEMNGWRERSVDSCSWSGRLHQQYRNDTRGLY
ncbi:hypothetical protein KGM_205341 [Danaus plexippus plexippus]|uniref:Uncharacterized protein n=1 Tax=Danaus plexippus plexippus TaxID=278856 RepID=A0A212FJU0_DANPL|nr:hypothetical protein KGM_205341 [Danaus plexippus plexippus]